MKSLGTYVLLFLLLLSPLCFAYLFKMVTGSKVKECSGEFSFNFKQKDQTQVVSSGIFNISLRSAGVGASSFSGFITYFDKTGKQEKQTILYREILYHYKISDTVLSVENISSTPRTTDNSNDTDVLKYVYSGMKSSFTGNHTINALSTRTFSLGDSKFPRILCKIKA